MKYLKKFNESKESIDDICRRYDITNYTINDDGSIDVDDVYLQNKGLSELPLTFRNVKGFFNCTYNELTSLKGAPISVGKYFTCAKNKLTSLKGGPQLVGSDFNCSFNQLISLEGAPQSVDGDFYCSDNNLITLNGLGDIGDFNCIYTPIYKWWRQVDDISKLEIFLYMNIYSNDPDDVNQDKIDEIMIDKLL